MEKLNINEYKMYMEKAWLDYEYAKSRNKEKEIKLNIDDYFVEELRVLDAKMINLLADYTRKLRDYELPLNVYLLRDMDCIDMSNIIEFCSMFSIKLIYYCDSSSGALKDLMYLWDHNWNITNKIEVNSKNGYKLNGFILKNMGDE